MLSNFKSIPFMLHHFLQIPTQLMLIKRITYFEDVNVQSEIWKSKLSTLFTT